MYKTCFFYHVMVFTAIFIKDVETNRYKKDNDNYDGKENFLYSKVSWYFACVDSKQYFDCFIILLFCNQLWYLLELKVYLCWKTFLPIYIPEYIMNEFFYLKKHSFFLVIYRLLYCRWIHKPQNLWHHFRHYCALHVRLLIVFQKSW